MPIFNTTDTYGSVSKFLHWIIALLVICMLAFGFFMDDIPKEYKGLVYNIHKLTGLAILLLMLLRVLWGLMNARPISLGTHILERWVERTVHLALYVIV